MMKINQLISYHARYRPNHTAVVFQDQRLSYAQFNARVNRVARALLALGLQKGDKFATILPNCLELVELYWAAAASGLVIVPTSPLLRGQGLTRLLNDSDSAAVIVDQAFAPILDELRGELPQVKHYLITDAPDYPGYADYHALAAAQPEDNLEVEVSPDDVYNIMYSSGTTGLPKGIIHTHAIRASYATLFANAYRITPESIILHTGAIIFNGAMLTFMPAFYLGATYILHPYFDPAKLIETVEKERVTHIKMVPSQIIGMLNSPAFDPQRLQSLQMVGSVGAPLHRAYKERLHAALPHRFYELYGLTEGGVLTILDKNDYVDKMDSVGTPIRFSELRVVDVQGKPLPPNQVGEIIGRSPLMMPSYYKRPDMTAETIRDGWMYSGDLGYLDEDGFLYLVDRKKDMIISGGVNVYPRDIEEIIVKHPDVREVAVFGIPDEKWGETPVAAVILQPGATITANELRDWINERVEARFQRVSRVIVREDFPRSAAGKTLKRVMRDELSS